MKFLSFSLVSVFATGALAFTSTNTASRSTSLEASRTEDMEGLRSRFSPSDWLQSRQPTRPKCGPCPDDEDATNTLEALFPNNSEKEDRQPTLGKDADMDRREAAFAMLGSLWATTTAVGATSMFPTPANAVYGAEPKIEMPNMMETMKNRASNQCLVESLGNRECLVWMDPENKLYQGVNTQKLLQKIDASSVALTRIPELVEDKKWMGVKGIVAGPMGELLNTMILLSPQSTKDPNKSATLAKQVKLEIFAISAAADKKDGKGVLKSYEGATNALVSYVESL